MSLVNIADLRALVNTSLTDPQLQNIIDREEAVIVRAYGEHYVDADTPVEESIAGNRQRSVYLRRKFIAINDVYETLYLGSTEYHLDPSLYHLWVREARLERLPSLAQANALGIPGGLWGAVVRVVYVPYDDNAERAEVIIELVRLAIERTAMRSENIAGEYSYSAPDWNVQRTQLLRRLRLD